MAKKRREFTNRTINEMLKEGRGKGEGRYYKPFLKCFLYVLPCTINTMSCKCFFEFHLYTLDLLLLKNLESIYTPKIDSKISIYFTIIFL